MPALNRRKLAAVAFGFALVAAFVLPFLRPTPPTPRYTVADLGLLPGDTESHAYGINARGAVAGFSQSGVYPQRSKQRACIFQNGKITELGVLRGATGSAVVSINAKEEATGLVCLPTTRQAFLYSGEGITSLGTRPGFSGSIGHAINDRGEVAGILVNNGWGQEHAFLYSRGAMMDLGVLPGAYKSEARGINTAGQVVGNCYFRGGRFHVVPFLYDTRRKTMTALPLPASCTHGRALAMSDHGLVVGSISDGTAGHAALWSGGHLTVLGVPGGYDQAEAEGLNNWGDIVGQCYREPSAFQAFLRSHAGDNNLWQRYVDRDASQGAFLYQDGRMQDLNTLIPADAGWRLEEAPCINDRGQIAGTGLHDGQRRAFLLTQR